MGKSGRSLFAHRDLSAQRQIHILNCQARLKRQVDPVPAVPHGMDIPRGPRILSAPGENQFRRAAPLARRRALHAGHRVRLSSETDPHPQLSSQAGLRGGVLCTLVIGSASAQKQIHILNCQARLKRQVDPVPAVPHGMDIPRGPRILSAPGENQFRRAAPLARRRALHAGHRVRLSSETDPHPQLSSQAEAPG